MAIKSSTTRQMMFTACAAALSITMNLSAPAWAADTTAAAEKPATEAVEYSVHSKLATKSLLLDVTKAGNRLVAVGEFGHIIYSDDGGANWTQAETVPTQVTLTSVDFVNDKTGYAGGHDCTVLRTDDGGVNWKLVYHDPASETPIMSVFFNSEERGFAMGAFHFVIETNDGGTTWEQRALSPDDKDDFHLNRIFGLKDGTLIIAAEAGNVYRSTDKGNTFQHVQTSYDGSFWGGVALADGSALVYGMRGHAFRSTDDGQTWTEVNTGTEKSISGGVQLANGEVVLVGLQGYVGYSNDGGKNFTAVTRKDRLSYAAVSEGPAGKIDIFGEMGVLTMPATPEEAQKEVGAQSGS